MPIIRYSPSAIAEWDVGMKQLALSRWPSLAARTCALLFLAFGLFSTRPVEADPVTMFAAASTIDALREIGALYESQGHDRVRFSFASSSTLAKQIENGAPADLYLSADELWMDYLERRNLVADGTRRDLLGNSLVLIAPLNSRPPLRIKQNFDLLGWLGDDRLAIGDPDHVPAGIYGRQALESLGVWRQLQSKLARASDVRGALAFVERGEAAAGIVYSTDVVRNKVRVLGTFPSDSHAPVRYPVAIVAGHDNESTRAFYEYLQSEGAWTIFVRYGFTAK